MPGSNPNVKVIKRTCVSCLILTRDGKILLQQRDDDCENFPGCLGTFGGGIEKNESAISALKRELREELGAEVDPKDVINLGLVTEEETDHTQLVHAYFWHDKLGTIKGCYEGKPRFYNKAEEVENHPKIMSDVRWMLRECLKQKRIPHKNKEKE